MPTDQSTDQSTHCATLNREKSHAMNQRVVLAPAVKKMKTIDHQSFMLLDLHGMKTAACAWKVCLCIVLFCKHCIAPIERSTSQCHYREVYYVDHFNRHYAGSLAVNYFMFLLIHILYHIHCTIYVTLC